MREYWLVDPDANKVTVYRRGDDAGLETGAPTERFADAVEHSSRDVLETSLLPGLEIPLADMFAS